MRTASNALQPGPTRSASPPSRAAAAAAAQALLFKLEGQQLEIVNHRWIEDCIRQWSRMPEDSEAYRRLGVEARRTPPLRGAPLLRRPPLCAARRARAGGAAPTQRMTQAARWRMSGWRISWAKLCTVHAPSAELHAQMLVFARAQSYPDAQEVPRSAHARAAPRV